MRRGGGVVGVVEHVSLCDLHGGRKLISFDRVFLQAVEKKFPGDKEKLARMSLIEGKCSSVQLADALHDPLTVWLTEGFPKNLRMANLACIGSRKVNGVAEVSSLSLLMSRWVYLLRSL